MIEDLKPYSEFKDAGLPWLGEVPAHWDVTPLGGLAQVKSVSNQSERQLLSVYLQHGVVRFADVQEKRTNTTSEDLSKYQAVDPGDFVLNNQQAWRGSVGVSDYSGIISPAYLVLKLSKRLLPRYANLLFRDQSIVSQYLVCSKGVGSIQRNLYWPHLKRIGVAIPPPYEQTAISRFLAWATNRLDRAIGAKRRIITLLQEQKQAIIHHSVTRGLDPSVQLKDSGIPWLGEIPEHWEVRLLGHAVCLQTGYPFTSTGFIQAQSGTRLLRGVNVTPSQIRWDEVVRWQRHVDDGLDDYTLQVGDVVLGMDRPIIGAGVRTALIRKDDTPSLLLQRVARLRSTEILDTEFMLLLLRGRTFHEYMAPIFTGISVPHLSPQQIKNFRVALPPIEEQRNIVAELMEQTYELDNAIDSNEKEITLLREYRTRLIADVVTGKLDVREVAAGLPEPHNANDEQLEPEEEEPEFEAEDVETESMD
jgi:type I restriction enzyme S subunit